MAYIGQGIKEGTFSVLDTSGNTYNGSNVTFSLGTQVGSPAQLLVSHDGVIQKPGTDYSLATGGTQITFSTAPASGASIFIVEISGAVGGPLDSDLNGTELILDADGDTSITADTDDQIDIKVAGTDQITIKDGAVSPVTDNDIDLGTSSLEFKDAYFDGTVTSDAGLFDTLGVITAKDLGAGIHIRTSDSSASAEAGADELVIENGSGDGGMSILGGTSSSGTIAFGDSGDDNIGRIVYAHANNTMRIVANAVNTAYFGSTEIVFNEDSNDQDFRVESNGNANAIFLDANNERLNIASTSAGGGIPGAHFGIDTFLSQFARNGSVPVEINRNTNDGSLVDFVQAGTTEGTVSVSGSTVSYNAFCGSHWSRLADNSKPTILRGTVMESIATMMTWYQAVADVEESTDSKGRVTPAYQVKEDIIIPDGKSIGDAVTFTSSDDKKEYTGVYAKEDNERLPMCKVSDTANSKAVYGVFMAWNDNDDGLDGDVNDMYVAALGAFVVRIHKDQTVAIGDYLVSNGDGTAKKQADDILRASTIAKVTSTEKTHTHADGSYCVPCTLHCG
jgi:hypothetical protein